MSIDDRFSTELFRDMDARRSSVVTDIAFALQEIKDYAGAVRRGLASAQAFVVIENDADRIADLISELVE